MTRRIACSVVCDRDVRLRAGPGLANGGAGGTTGSMGAWKTVHASASAKNLTALAAHPNAPLLATGTATQARARACSGSLCPTHSISRCIAVQCMRTDQCSASGQHRAGHRRHPDWCLQRLLGTLLALRVCCMEG